MASILHQYLASIHLDVPTITDIICLTANLTHDYDSSHNLSHHFSVFQNTLKIMETWHFGDRQQDAMLMATYAALLHDTVDYKYPVNIDIKRQAVEEFLQQKIGHLAQNIKWIIDNISYSKEIALGYPRHDDAVVQLIRDIVSDADKLDAIGEIGLRRCRDYNAAKYPELGEHQITQLVVKHCHDKLLSLRDNYIRTKTGRELAIPLHDKIVEFVAQHTIKSEF